MAMESIRVRILEMLDAIETVEHLISGLDFELFKRHESRGLRRGVERCIEIVSEASRHLPEDIRRLHPEIPWRNIRDIGNVLRHGYGSVDNQIIWDVATVRLPELDNVLQRMLAILPPDTE